jgi:hypothetical protein
MSEWRERALELFPDMRADIERAESVGMLWGELESRFNSYYRSVSKGETEEPYQLVRAIYDYAIWCSHAKADHTFNAATSGFYEDVTSHAFRSVTSTYERIIKDLVSNLGLSEIKRMRWAFAASIEPHQLEKFMADCERTQRELRRASQQR